MEIGAGKVAEKFRPRSRRAEGVPGTDDFGAGFDGLFMTRQKEAKSFTLQESLKSYLTMRKPSCGSRLPDAVVEAVLSLHVQTWLEAILPARPTAERWKGRNKDWTHLYNDDIMSMPDKWSIRGTPHGLGVSLHSNRARRSRFCQRAAHPSSARMVHAPNGQLLPTNGPSVM